MQLLERINDNKELNSTMKNNNIIPSILNANYAYSDFWYLVNKAKNDFQKICDKIQDFFLIYKKVKFVDLT